MFVGLTREEFCNIFLFRPKPDLEYSYISFMKSLDLLSCWNGIEHLEKLTVPDYEVCYVSYFKRGKVNILSFPNYIIFFNKHASSSCVTATFLIKEDL